MTELNPGDLILWVPPGEEEAIIAGILVERHDLYRKRRIASRVSYKPSWAWRIEFAGEIPRNYNRRYGVLERNLLNGVYGDILRMDVKQ